MRVHQVVIGTFLLALTVAGCEQPNVVVVTPTDNVQNSSKQSTSPPSSSAYDTSTSATKIADGIYYAVIDPGQNHLAIVDGVWHVEFEHVHEWAKCDIASIPSGGFRVSVYASESTGNSPYELEFLPAPEDKHFKVLVDGKPFQGFEDGFFRELDVEMLNDHRDTFLER